jgi:ATPase family associated with various cellular activities (AAA)
MDNIPSWTSKITMPWLSSDSGPYGWAKLALEYIATTNKTPPVTDFYKRGKLLRAPEDIVKDLLALGGRVFKQTDDLAFHNKDFMWDEACVHFRWETDDGQATLEGHVITGDLFNKLTDLVLASIGEPKASGEVFALTTTQLGVGFCSIGYAACPLERGNYNIAVIKEYDHVVADLKSTDPCGRLVILEGVPGSGKSYMVRGLLEEVPDATFAIVPAHMVASLATPTFVQALMDLRGSIYSQGGYTCPGDEVSGKDSSKPIIFIIEDADECLTSRAADNMNSVSALLNLGDGIFGAMFDIRVVCTTNAKNEQLDSAVKRPGRLCRFLHIGHLDPEVAAGVFKRLTGKDKTFPKATIAEVYRLARNEGWVPEKETKFGFQIGED